MLTRAVPRRSFMIGTSAALLGVGSRARAAPAFKTVEPGILTVANDGELPMITVEDGQLIGSDAEMIVAIAKKLGLAVKSAQMEWSATVQSVKSGRADIMAGNMGWTPARAAALAITDAIYYAGAFICMKQELPFSDSISVADIKGHSIGTVNGFTKVPEMKKIPGTTEVKLYDSSDGCVRDVVAGRLDFAVLDAPLVAYMILKNPNWNLKQVPVLPDPAFPQFTSKQHAVLGMSLDNPDLFDAVNQGVKWVWATKQNAASLHKFGIVSPDYMVPPAKNPRIGVDRDEAGNITGPGAHTPKDYSALFA